MLFFDLYLLIEGKNMTLQSKYTSLSSQLKRDFFVNSCYGALLGDLSQDKIRQEPTKARMHAKSTNTLYQ